MAKERLRYRSYSYSDQVNLGAWVVLILLEGMIAGMTLYKSELPFFFALWFPVPFLLPLILYREEATVHEDTGQVSVRKGYWPFARRHRYEKGELRRVVATGGNFGLTSILSLWIEDRHGYCLRLCTEGPEVLDGCIEEAEELSNILGVPLDYAQSYYAARVSILSNRRPRWLAGWELVGTGAAVLLFTLYVAAAVRGGALPMAAALRGWNDLSVGDTNWANLVQWLGTFLALALLILGVPLLWENKDHWARKK